MQAYIQSCKLGAKAISLYLLRYRDGSKRTRVGRPLTRQGQERRGARVAGGGGGGWVKSPIRRKLPDEGATAHPQVRHRGHGATSHGRTVLERPARENLPVMRGGFDEVSGLPTRSRGVSYALQTACRSRRWSTVQPRPFRASGMTRKPGDSVASRSSTTSFRWMASKFPVQRRAVHAGVNEARFWRALRRGRLPLRRPAPRGPSGRAASTARNQHSTIQNQKNAPPCSTCALS